MELAALRRHAEEARKALERRRAARDLVQQQLESARARVQEATERVERLGKVHALFEMAGQVAMEAARQQTESMVTEALRAVFGDRLSFQVEVGGRAGRPEATFRVRSDDGSGSAFAAEPMEAHGGGVTDVLSLALRLVLLEGAQPPIAGPLVLDEPGKHVSAGYAPHLAAFLRTVSREFSRQVILVTHNEELAAAADVAYHVELDGGVSRVILRETAVT